MLPLTCLFLEPHCSLLLFQMVHTLLQRLAFTPHSLHSQIYSLFAALFVLFNEDSFYITAGGQWTKLDKFVVPSEGWAFDLKKNNFTSKCV